MANNKSEAAWRNVSRLSRSWSTHTRWDSRHPNSAAFWEKVSWDKLILHFSPDSPCPGTSHLLLLSSAVSFPTFQCGHLSSSTYTQFLFLAASPLKPRYTNLVRPRGTHSLGGVCCVCCHINDIIKLQASRKGNWDWYAV